MNIKTIIKVAALAATIMSLSSCYIRLSDSAREDIRKNFPRVTYGELDSVVYRPGDFSKMTASGRFDVIFVADTTDPRVVVVGRSNLRDSVKVKNDDGTLRIFRIVESHSDEKVIVFHPGVNDVTSYGSGDIHFRGTFHTDTLRLRNGSGDLSADSMLDCEVLYLQNNGSGDVKGSFSCRKAYVDGVGSGDMRLTIRGADSLRVDLRGSGDMRIDGDAVNVDFSKAGSGDVDARNLKAGKVTVSSKSGSGELRYKD